mmetsp:Transcript_31597/g.57947  ORF Transcript_31597/g.57947 Transcript_31597/m.57947 type:complete len:286 (-) Transcript_31597:74-931(-)
MMDAEVGNGRSAAASRARAAPTALGNAADQEEQELVDVDSRTRHQRIMKLQDSINEDIGGPSLEDLEADEDAPLIYPDMQAAKLQRSAEGRCFSYVRFGRIVALNVCGNRTVYVGPHWYTGLIMLAVILGVGGLFITHVAMTLGKWHMIGGFTATLGSTAAFLNCALADPGILRKTPINGPEDERACEAEPGSLMPSNGRWKCKACRIVQPKGSLHCEYCQVCVGEYDHHCPWMSKCIGGKNLLAFYNFLCVSLSSLVFIVVATIFSPQVVNPHQHHHRGRISPH